MEQLSRAHLLTLLKVKKIEVAGGGVNPELEDVKAAERDKGDQGGARPLPAGAGFQGE